ncbi:MAG: hypothetical protein ACAF41_21020 [Leptolyngbya sp. BL-A-14]
MLAVVRRDPQVLGYAQSRWTLQAIAHGCEALQVTTKAGLSQLLARLGISYKRGRDYLHRPDRFYEEKRSQIELALLRAWYEPQRYVLVYLDEFGLYRQPTVAQDWEVVGASQPLARRSHKSDTCYRGVGALNALTGQVTDLLRSEISVAVLCQRVGHSCKGQNPQRTRCRLPSSTYRRMRPGSIRLRSFGAGCGRR